MGDFFSVLAGTCAAFSSPLSARSEDPTEVRGWVLLVDDMDYLRETIRKAPEFGINHIQLSHEVVHFADQLIDEPDRCRNVRELVQLGKSLGLQMVIWTHELHAVPEKFCVGVDKRANLDDPKLWTWLAERYQKLYELVPELDGVVVSLSETGPAAVTRETGVISTMQRQLRVAKIGEVLNRVHEPLGKRVIIRDFGETLWARQGILLCPDPVWAMTKVIFGDWQPYSEHSITYGYYGDRPLIVEFDLCGEYLGQSVIPWCDPAYIKYRWDHAAKAGSPKGAVARIGRDEYDQHHAALGTPNEINIEMFCRLMHDRNTDPDVVWKEWTVKTYGADAAPQVETALRRSAEFTRRIYWGDRLADYRIQQHSFIPSFDYALSHDRSYMQTCQIDPEIFLINPGKVESEMERRYDTILPVIAASLEDLSQAEAHLEAAKYNDLRERLEMSSAVCQAFKAVHQAFIRYLTLEFGLKHTDVYADAVDHHRKRVPDDIAQMNEIAGHIDQRFGDRLDLTSGERIRTFMGGLCDAYQQIGVSTGNEEK
jgi:hypothetical protein